jgi:hypothetical protein
MAACDDNVDFGQVKSDSGPPNEAGADGTVGDASEVSTPVDTGTSPLVDGAGDAMAVADGSSSPSDAAGGGSSDSPSEGAAVDAGIDLLSGAYAGYVEAFQVFDDHSSSLRMQLELQSDGTVTGTVSLPFADGGTLAPPTDPSVGYPPNLGALGPQLYSLGEGFVFTLKGGTYTASRIRLTLEESELWSQWCAVQTPVPQYDYNPDGGLGCGSEVYGYGCMPSGGVLSYESPCAIATCDSPDGGIPVDCGKLRLCSNGGGGEIPAPFSVCTCTSTECHLNAAGSGASKAMSGYAIVAFDLQLTAGHLDGSTTWLDGTVYNVHLTHVP